MAFRALLPILSTLARTFPPHPVNACLTAYSGNNTAYQQARCLTGDHLSGRHSPGQPCRRGVPFPSSLATPALDSQPCRRQPALMHILRHLHNASEAKAAAHAAGSGGEVAGGSGQSNSGLDVDTVDCVVIGAGVLPRTKGARKCAWAGGLTRAKNLFEWLLAPERVQQSMAAVLLMSGRLIRKKDCYTYCVL